MKYGLRKLVLGASYKKFIEISEDEFNSLSLAKETLLEINEIEEYLDCLVENYYELERELLEMTLRYALFRDLDHVSFSIERTKTNRRLANLLSSTRGYLDRLERFSKKSEFATILEAKMKNFRARAYDENLSYRLLEGLRNYIQHFGHGVHIFTHDSKWVETDFGEAIKNNSILSLEVHILEQAKIVKKCIANELKEIGQIVDLRPHIRNYVALIGQIHLDFKEEFKSKIEEFDKKIIQSISNYLDTFPEEKDSTGLNAVKMKKENETEINFPIFSKIIDLRKFYERKNYLLKSINKHIISNEISKKKI